MSVDKLKGDNWEDWKYQVTCALKGQGLWRFVDGTASDPTDDAGLQKKDQALAVLVGSIHCSQIYLIRGKEDPTEVWKILK